MSIVYEPPGPVARDFITSDAFVVGILGPIGSGKSTAAVMKVVKNFQSQQPGPDGWRRRRTAIIRNTYPELRTTTIKTWHQWVPPDTGTYRDAGPPSHHIVDQSNKLEWEVIFVALDRPEDVRKLLSMELSDAWINEAREVPKAILDGLTGRVGRFPKTIRDDQDRILFTCTDPQIIMDTNPPDADHWWFRLAESPTPEDSDAMRELEEQLVAAGGLRPGQRLYQWFRQPGGESPGAENLRNLTPGYYLKTKANKSREWVKVYVDAEYGFVMDGKPVYPDYRDGVHCKEFSANQRLGLHVGMDFGLTPAAVFAQQMPNGQWRKHSELVTENMGIVRFAELFKRHVALTYPGFKLLSITGDPAGDARNDDERTTYDILKAGGVFANPAKSNQPTLRIEAVSAAMRRMVDGEPGMLIHPQCRTLRKAYAGGYSFKRVQVAGTERYRDVPDKDLYSHVADADQYVMIGAGEGKAVVQREPIANRPLFALTDDD